MNSAQREECYSLVKNAIGHGHVPSFEDFLYDNEGMQINYEELKQWYENIFELHYLKNLLKPDIIEIHIHAPNKICLYSLIGRSHCEIILNPQEFQLSLEVLALKNSQKWNYTHPFCSFTALYYDHALRFSLSHYITSAHQISKLFVRVSHKEFISLENFGLTSEQQSFCHELIHSKKNIIVSGATGSGKTTFLRTLINCVDKNEHLCILEDTHELYNHSDYATHFLQDENNKLRDFCAYALRISPDRIILGEIRSDEIIPFVLSMNNGHKGLMTSLHANSAEDALQRMALLFSLFSESKDISYEIILNLICKNVDTVIHLENKKIKSIINVLGSEGSHTYFENQL